MDLEVAPMIVGKVGAGLPHREDRGHAGPRPGQGPGEQDPDARPAHDEPDRRHPVSTGRRPCEADIILPRPDLRLATPLTRVRIDITLEEDKRAPNGKDTGAAMTKLFGTDGIRAVAGAFPLDPPSVRALGKALASLLREEGLEPRVIVGRDTRESGAWMEGELVRGFREGRRRRRPGRGPSDVGRILPDPEARLRGRDRPFGLP